MALAALHGVSHGYAGRVLFRDVDLEVHPGDRIALVGRNGAGKTTLLRLLSGEEEPDAGRVARARGTQVGVLEQDPAFDPGDDVRAAAARALAWLDRLEEEARDLEARLADDPGDDRDALVRRLGDVQESFERGGGWSREARTDAVLEGVGFRTEGEKTRSTRVLSGGERARLALARLLLDRPGVLLLDEPTNHLDLDGVEWLEDFCRRHPAAWVTVSHDRAFLENVCRTVWCLEERTVTAYRGGLAGFERRRAEERAHRQAAHEKAAAEKARQEAFIRKHMASQRTAEAKGRRKRLERFEVPDAPEPDARPPLPRSLGETDPGGDPAMIVADLEVAPVADGPVLVGPADFEVRAGEVLGIVGPNGSGKTTLLRTLTGDLPARAGTVRLGSRVTPAVYDQHLSDVPQTGPVSGALAGTSVDDQREVRGLLGRFGFRGDVLEQDIADLSGGERARLALCRLLVRGGNLLMLDEPTNHLDLPARDALEEALGEFGGTVIVVSHDRRLLGDLADRILSIEPGPEPDAPAAAVMVPGGWERFLEHRRERAESAEAAAPRRDTSGRSDDGGTDADAAAAAGESRIPPGGGLTLDELTDRIVDLEQQERGLTAMLALPENYGDPDEAARLERDLRRVRDELETLNAEWAERA